MKDTFKEWLTQNGLILKDKVELVKCGGDSSLKICSVVGKLPEPPQGIVKVKIT